MSKQEMRIALTAIIPLTSAAAFGVVAQADALLQPVVEKLNKLAGVTVDYSSAAVTPRADVKPREPKTGAPAPAPATAEPTPLEQAIEDVGINNDINRTFTVTDPQVGGAFGAVQLDHKAAVKKLIELVKAAPDVAALDALLNANMAVANELVAAGVDLSKITEAVNKTRAKLTTAAAA
jgi:hypothetical protein